jgi:hypothetical protein
MLAVIPLVWLPIKLAAATFVALGSTWLAYVVTRDGWWRLYMFTGAGFFSSFMAVQWAPLLMAAGVAGIPAGVAAVVKPTMAVPLLAMQTSRRTLICALVAGATLVALSLVVQSRWPIAWYRTLATSPIHSEYVSPALTLLGLPLWLALLRWRDWRARLLFGMAITPLNAFSYAHFPLLLVARNRLELAALALASWIAFFLTIRITFRLAAGTPLVAVTRHVEWIAVAGYYLPALVCLLRRPEEQDGNASLRRVDVEPQGRLLLH